MDNQLANYFQGVDLDTNYIQGVDLDTNYFQGVDLDSAPGDPGMNIELLSPDSNGMGDGSTASVEDTSSDIDLDGDLGPGYKQCFVCGKWKKDDGNFKKHMNTHNRQVPCEALLGIPRGLGKGEQYPNREIFLRALQDIIC
ncbi:hypothetical protein Trisim1_007484 [Trichoderma cf. simile WF8]